MSLLTNDPITQLAFSTYENKGVYAILLGSGVSRAAQIPTGWEITLDLVRRIARGRGVPEQTDWRKWHYDQVGTEPNYSSLLEELAASPQERRAILHSYIEPTERDREEGRKLPTAAHHSIAALVRSGYVRVIITTNFDRLMENALRESGVEPTVVASLDALTGAEPLTHSSCYLLKLHGDYKDARIRNTESELNAYPEEIDRLLDTIFDEYGLIVSGWSGEWDQALRNAILRARNRRYATFWGMRGTVGDGAQQLIAHRNAKVIPNVDADALFAQLQQRVETLSLTHRQNPLSIDLLVESAKRYLSKSEFRIQLDDLFSQEMERLTSALQADVFSPNSPCDNIKFSERVRMYEAASEALARMASVVGRWGNGSELQLILDCINSLLNSAARFGGGFTTWLNLRSYPAVLIFVSYSMALTRAGRLKTLHTLLTAKLAPFSNEPQRVVDTLFLWRWSGGTKETWHAFDGLKDRRTPLSDHLCEVVGEWKSSFFGIGADFEALYDHFEVLSALACFEEDSESTLEAALLTSGGRWFSRMPVGRVGWRHASLTAILRELGSDPFADELLNAGFGRNSRRFIELFGENLRRFGQQMSW